MVLRCGAVVACGLACSAGGQLVIDEQFDSGDAWGNLGIGNVGLSGTGFQGSDGNPGGRYQIGLSVGRNVTLGGAGFLSSSTFDLSAFVGGTISVQTDYRFTPGFFNTAAGLGIVLSQDNRAYYPLGDFQPTGTLDQWVTLPERTWAIGDLFNSSGIPLDLSRPVQIGVGGFFENASGLSPRTEFSLDNVRIEIMPAPAGVAVVLSGFALTHRRRRHQP